MMSLSPRDRLILTIAIAAVVVVGLAALLIYPQFQELGTLSASVSDATAQSQAAKLQLAERQGFKDRAVETDAKWLRLMNQVPDTPDLPSLIIELQDLAFTEGVQLVAITPALPASEGSFESVPVSLEVIGSWGDTVDFLEALMKTDRGLRITKMNIGIANDATRINTSLKPYSVDTALSIKAYMIPSTTANAPAGAAAPKN